MTFAKGIVGFVLALILGAVALAIPQMFYRVSFMVLMVSAVAIYVIFFIVFTHFVLSDHAMVRGFVYGALLAILVVTLLLLFLKDPLLGLLSNLPTIGF